MHTYVYTHTHTHIHRLDKISEDLCFSNCLIFLIIQNKKSHTISFEKMLPKLLGKLSTFIYSSHPHIIIVAKQSQQLEKFFFFLRNK